MTLGERLVALRKENGYPVRKNFAEALDMPETTLRNYETNVREPGHSFLIRISEMFNVSIDWLLGISDEKERKSSYLLKSSEYELIKSYRSLDAHGKRMVDFVLSEELNRVESESEPEYILAAAHEDSSRAAPEQKQHADEIMMDDKERK